MRIHSFIPVQEAFQIEHSAGYKPFYSLVHIRIRSAQIGFNCKCIGVSIQRCIEIQVISL